LREGLKALAYVHVRGHHHAADRRKILDVPARHRLPSNVGKEVMRMDDNKSDGFRAVQPHRQPLEVMAG
jgi:hypothetical protein